MLQNYPEQEGPSEAPSQAVQPQEAQPQEAQHEAAQEAAQALKEAEASLAAQDEKPSQPTEAKQEKAASAEVAAKEATQESDPYRKKYMYLMAEFDNYKKQSFKERAELIKYASTRVLCDLLDIIDDFDRALHIETDDIKTFRQGVQMTAKNLLSTLEKHGLQCDNTQPGTAFDPSVHEALSRQASDKVQPGHILHVHKKAYRLHDKLVRPAQVVVAEAQQQTESESATGGDSNTPPDQMAAAEVSSGAEVGS